MGGVNSRAKGQRGEREIVDFWKQLGWSDAHRTPASGGMKWKGDVQGVGAAPYKLHIEVKRNEALNIWAALKQAEKDAPADSIRTVHFRRNGTEWYVALPLTDFARIYPHALESHLTPVPVAA